MKIQSCGTCKYWERSEYIWENHNRGGKCKYPIPEWLYQIIQKTNPWAEMESCDSLDGTTCTTYEPQKVREKNE